MSKKYLCQVCGDSFSTPNSLSCHIEIHNDVKRFPCDVCGKTFRRKDKLRFHSYVHSGEKPFKCTTCDKAFVRKAKLDDHLRRHRGEKRFCCLVCNKTYAGSWDLRVHLRKVHPKVSQRIKSNVPLTPQIISNIALIENEIQESTNQQITYNDVLDDDDDDNDDNDNDVTFPSMENNDDIKLIDDLMQSSPEDLADSESQSFF